MNASWQAYQRLLADHPEVGSTRDVLRRVERKVWGIGTDEGADPPILALELEQARATGAKERTSHGWPRPRLLILPVGYSPEPLLLSIACHAPEEVVLLAVASLEDAYQVELGTVWDRYHAELGVEPFAEVKERRWRVVRDSAPDVFQAVRGLVGDRQDLEATQIAVDITGGKKSMVAGAFLAAAYLKTTIAYVDFDRYDPVLRRPEPGSLRPGRLHDPYRLFRLREADRLEGLMDAGRYAEAEQLARDLSLGLENPDVQDALGAASARSEARRFGALADAAAAYQAWSEGFYADARRAIEAAGGLPMPPTLEVLAEVWPGRESSRGDIVNALDEETVFANPVVPLAYFLDILTWWGDRRLGENPREGFSRLYGTMESLLSFLCHCHAGPELTELVVDLPPDGRRSLRSLVEEAPQTRSGEPIDWLHEIRSSAGRSAMELVYTSSSRARRLLSGGALECYPELPPGLELPATVKAKRVGAHLPQPVRVRLVERVLPNHLNRRLWKLKDLRNKTTHWMAPVPVADAQALRDLLRDLLLETLPAAVDRLEAAGADADVREWSERLLGAARGSVAAEYRPLATRKLLERVYSRGGTPHSSKQNVTRAGAKR